jgi:hypothetical protein
MVVWYITVRQHSILHKAVIWIFALCIFLLFRFSFCVADAPYENFFINSKEIPADSLKNIIGILSIDFSDPDYYHSERSNSPAAVQLFDKPVGKPLQLLTIGNAYTISGIDWNGGITRRFPVIATIGEYVQIIFDVRHNTRAWIRMKKIPLEKRSEKNSHLDTVFSTDQKCKAELTLFDSIGNKPMPADIFSLMKEKPRKFYAMPAKDSQWFTDMDQRSETLAKKAASQGYFNSGGYYISDVKNGYTRVTARYCNDDSECAHFDLGWIGLYDNNSRLTVWYQYRQVP